MQTYTNNGYTGKLTLENEFGIFDRYGRCVLWTDNANVEGTRSKWLKRQVDVFPLFLRELGREDLLKENEQVIANENMDSSNDSKT